MNKNKNIHASGIVLMMAAAFAAPLVLEAQEKPALEAQEKKEPRLRNIKQLTAGGSNAEAYYSPDGSKVVFQATRDGLKCDQIFVMDADGGHPRMVSSGKGRTTCGYFTPDGKSILYGSTHEGGDACPAEPDRSKGYLWPVYETYDLYRASLDGKLLGKWNPAPGYDAEATVNNKTGKVIFTSMRDGDLNLWVANVDGRKLRQVTKRVGYDGGAFFSPDGKKIVWRANYPKTPEAEKDYKDKLKENLTAPMKMELFIADANGNNVKQLTDFGCASFAPSFSADGRKIVFSSNKTKCDSRFFDLFVMNADGSGLEQVTHTGNFNSFAVFSPDGKKLMWISDRHAKARFEFNIFTADWAQ